MDFWDLRDDALTFKTSEMAELPPVNQLHYATMKRALTASLLKPKGDPLSISASVHSATETPVNTRSNE